MSEQAPAVTGIAALAVDCQDPSGLARWWSRLLGGEVEVDPDGDATLHTSGGLAIDFARVPEPKTVKNRLHLDLRSTDLAEATAQAVALGATRAAGRSCATPRATSSACSGPGPDAPAAQGRSRNQRGRARTSDGGPSSATCRSTTPSRSRCRRRWASTDREIPGRCAPAR
jgi:hypothetical protein